MAKKRLTPIRLWWKWWWRQQRIIKRESAKAHMDQLLYGTGFVQISADLPDGIRHIPISEVVITRNGEV